MKKEYEALIGELIGLARATDGNEHLITPSATEVIRSCLHAVYTKTGDISCLLEQILEEKRKMVPNCFICANPCGRTSAFDFSELPAGPIRELKLALLDTLCAAADSVPEHILYRDLAIISIPDYTEEDLLPMLRELS